MTLKLSTKREKKYGGGFTFMERRRHGGFNGESVEF
jgi:hypothetical protein